MEIGQIAQDFVKREHDSFRQVRLDDNGILLARRGYNGGELPS